MGKTISDKKHEMKMLVWGFLLTTLVGGILTFLNQYLQDGRILGESKRDSFSFQG
jgi:hypothetical protein